MLIMKLHTRITATVASLGVICAAEATLTDWQDAVGVGTTAASTVFSTISGELQESTPRPLSWEISIPTVGVSSMNNGT